ncbi:hypothetical protein ACQRDY_05410, partial [Ligilactobacillus ruminis]
VARIFSCSGRCAKNSLKFTDKAFVFGGFVRKTRSETPEFLLAKRCFLEFARNLRQHGFGEGNRVEHFSKFLRFCSTLRAARAEFGLAGRQKRDISRIHLLA